jgi:hypothetical protein
MKVKIRSKVGAHAIVTSINGKDYIVKFEKPDFIAEVPTEISFKDAFGKTFLFHKNYAQHLINVYPELEIVAEIQEPAVIPKMVEVPVVREIPKITEEPKAEPIVVNTPKITKKVKEIKNETNN